MSPLAAALALWGAWTLVTWLLEGLPRTLLRPEAQGLRMTYAVVANLAIGLGGAGFVLRRLVGGGALSADAAGFGRAPRAAVAVAAGMAAGAALYVLQGAPVTDTVVLANAFAQVLTTSAAEVAVCWSVIGAVIAAGRGRLAGSVVASVLFGIYHVAHSPPLDTPRMIALLTVVGFVTSAFFFVSRDVLGTVVFHNWLGTFGVGRALVESGTIHEYARPNIPLLVTAVVTVAIVASVYAAVRRR